MLQIDPAHLSIIKRFQKTAPVDVMAIAEGLGLNVWEDDLPSGVSGKLFRDPDNGGSSGYSIVINSPEPSVRKRFTIAHEIAHYVLHRNKIDSGIEDDTFYRSRLSNALEAEANRLAAAILMPFELIDELQREGTSDLSEIAQKLQVSQHALKIRLGIPVVD